MKRAIIGAVATLASVGAVATPALGAADRYCGSSSNGCAAAAAAGAQCGTGAASGSFGAFGPGNNFAGGANGEQAGLNNSGVCGNRQGNP
jgi:hypothetical protein